MNKNRQLYKIIGYIIAIGCFVLFTIYLLVDWGLISISLPDIPFNIWTMPMIAGIIIAHYRPDLSKTTKILTWSSVTLLGISLLMLSVSHVPWIRQACEWGSIVGGALALLTWLKMYNEVEFLNEEDDDQQTDNHSSTE